MADQDEQQDWTMRKTMRNPERVRAKGLLPPLPTNTMRESMQFRSTSAARAAILLDEQQRQCSSQVAAVPPVPTRAQRRQAAQRRDVLGRLEAKTMRKPSSSSSAPVAAMEPSASTTIDRSFTEWPNSLSDYAWPGHTASGEGPSFSQSIPEPSGPSMRRPNLIKRLSATSAREQRGNPDAAAAESRKERTYERMLERVYSKKKRDWRRRPGTSESAEPSLSTKLPDWAQGLRRRSSVRPSSAGSRESHRNDGSSQGKLTSTLRGVAARLFYPKPKQLVISHPIVDEGVFMADRIAQRNVVNPGFTSWMAEDLARQEQAAGKPASPIEAVYSRNPSESAQARAADLDDFLLRHPDTAPTHKKPQSRSAGLIGKFTQPILATRYSKGKSDVTSSPMSFVCCGEYAPSDDGPDPFADLDDNTQFQTGMHGLGITTGDPYHMCPECQATNLASDGTCFACTSPGLRRDMASGLQSPVTIHGGQIDANRPEIIDQPTRVRSTHPALGGLVSPLRQHPTEPHSSISSNEDSPFLVGANQGALEDSDHYLASDQNHIISKPQPLDIPKLRNKGKCTNLNSLYAEQIRRPMQHYSVARKPLPSELKSSASPPTLWTWPRRQVEASEVNQAPHLARNRYESWMTLNSPGTLNLRDAASPGTSFSIRAATRAAMLGMSGHQDGFRDAPRDLPSPISREEDHASRVTRDSAFYNFYDDFFTPDLAGEEDSRIATTQET